MLVKEVCVMDGSGLWGGMLLGMVIKEVSVLRREVCYGGVG